MGLAKCFSLFAQMILFVDDSVVGWTIIAPLLRSSFLSSEPAYCHLDSCWSLLKICCIVPPSVFIMSRRFYLILKSPSVYSGSLNPLHLPFPLTSHNYLFWRFYNLPWQKIIGCLLQLARWKDRVFLHRTRKFYSVRIASAFQYCLL